MDQNARLLQSVLLYWHWFQFLLLLLFLLSSCLFLLEGFSLLFLMSLFCNFGGFLDNLHVVHIAIVSLNCSQFFSDQNEPACALMAESDRSRSPVPGRNRADPGAAAQPVRQEPPFFPRWCGPCKQRFGNRNGCHGLSIDLSFVLSSTCHSRDLMLEIHP